MRCTQFSIRNVPVVIGWTRRPASKSRCNGVLCAAIAPGQELVEMKRFSLANVYDHTLSCF